MIQLFKVNMPYLLMPELEKTLYSGYITEGPKTKEFERGLGELLGNPRVAVVNSGTSALTLALRLLNVEGGEVITTPMTCVATNVPILENRATPVWADVDPETGLIDPNDVEKKLTKKTKAILAVDWGGLPCNFDELVWASSAEIPIVEDAAHALGALYGRGELVGNGKAVDVTCFSFQAIKHITTGDGGALAFGEDELHSRAKKLRWFGVDRDATRKDFRVEEDVEEWGYKFHMNDIAASIGLAQLPHVNRIVNQHRANALFYWHMAKNDKLEEAFPERALSFSAFWLYTLRARSREERQKFIAHMAKRGVQTSQVHVRNDKHTAFKAYQRDDLFGVNEFNERCVAIPVHASLTDEELHTIAKAVREF